MPQLPTPYLKPLTPSKYHLPGSLELQKKLQGSCFDKSVGYLVLPCICFPKILEAPTEKEDVSWWVLEGPFYSEDQDLRQEIQERAKDLKRISSECKTAWADDTLISTTCVKY